MNKDKKPIEPTKDKGVDFMSAMAKPIQGVYEFNVKKESYENVISRINEQRLKSDFIEECFRVASKYKKPENKK
jgi:hypothetical protein